MPTLPSNTAKTAKLGREKPPRLERDTPRLCLSMASERRLAFETSARATADSRRQRLCQGTPANSHVMLPLRVMGQITTWVYTVDKVDPIPGLLGGIHPLPTPYIMSITPVEMIKG
eukprot:1184499-Prorocentrum_minimum.AAC.1